MLATNTPQTFGSVTRTFHWLTALIILSLIPLGIIANRLPYDTGAELALKASLFQVHKTLGVTVFFVALARIAWALSQPKPAPLHPDRRAETFVAHLVHWLLYAALVLVPLTGWIGHAATTGFAPIWWPFGQDLPFVPKSEFVAQTFASLHIIFERVLMVSILLHVAGALKHHFMDRDATLRRMWNGASAGSPAAKHTSRAAPIAAIGVYAVALGIGSALGVFAAPADRAPAPALAAVASDWTVADGTIALTVTQFGLPVTGAFEDWTASITFDPDAPGSDAPVGHVTTTIAIASMTLGSVTDQALGADFLNAAAYPTAIFDADLFRTPTGYEARGTLTFKETTLPLSFPFDLTLEGQSAAVTATTSLNRLDFAVGETMPGESTVAFAVNLALELTAIMGATD